MGQLLCWLKKTGSEESSSLDGGDGSTKLTLNTQQKRPYYFFARCLRVGGMLGQFRFRGQDHDRCQTGDTLRRFLCTSRPCPTHELSLGPTPAHRSPQNKPDHRTDCSNTRRCISKWHLLLWSSGLQHASRHRGCVRGLIGFVDSSSWAHARQQASRRLCRRSSGRWVGGQRPGNSRGTHLHIVHTYMPR